MITISSNKHVEKICKALDRIPCNDGTRGPLCGFIRQPTGKRNVFRYTKTNGHILVSFVSDSEDFHHYVDKFYYPTELSNGVLYQTAKEQQATAPNGVSGAYPDWKRIIPTFPCAVESLPYIAFSASYVTILLNVKKALLDLPTKKTPDIFVPKYTTSTIHQDISAKAEIYGDEIFSCMPMRIPPDKRPPHGYEDVSFFDKSESEFHVDVEKCTKIHESIVAERTRIYKDVLS